MSLMLPAVCVISSMFNTALLVQLRCGCFGTCYENDVSVSVLQLNTTHHRLLDMTDPAM